MKLRKVGIIGTGHVGSHVAFSLALQGEVDELYMMVPLKNVVIVTFLFLVQVHYLIYIKIA